MGSEMCIRDRTDAGNPVVASNPGHPAARAYLLLADKVARRVEEVSTAASASPKITISND